MYFHLIIDFFDGTRHVVCYDNEDEVNDCAGYYFLMPTVKAVSLKRGKPYFIFFFSFQHIFTRVKSKKSRP